MAVNQYTGFRATSDDTSEAKIIAINEDKAFGFLGDEFRVGNWTGSTDDQRIQNWIDSSESLASEIFLITQYYTRADIDNKLKDINLNMVVGSGTTLEDNHIYNASSSGNFTINLSVGGSCIIYCPANLSPTLSGGTVKYISGYSDVSGTSSQTKCICIQKVSSSLSLVNVAIYE